MRRSETYVIAAGGTGGHIFPGIALAREIVAPRPGARVVFVGTAAGLEARLVPAAGFPLETVRATGFAGKASGARDRWRSPRLPLGILEARRLLARLAPRAVAGVGGYVSVPVLLAARSLGDPDAHPRVQRAARGSPTGSSPASPRVRPWGSSAARDRLAGRARS